MPELLEKARAALQDADAQTRIAGLQLVQSQSLAPLLPDVAARLRADPDVAVRYQAARALAHFADPAALPPLLDGLRDDDMYVRVQVTSALIRVGAPAVAGLTEALDDARPAVRRAAAKALGKIGCADAAALQRAGRGPVGRRGRRATPLRRRGVGAPGRDGGPGAAGRGPARPRCARTRCGGGRPAGPG